MFKVKNDIAPEILKELLVLKISPYDLCYNNWFQGRRVNSVCNGTESVSYLGPKIKDLVPSEIKQSVTLNSFKNRIKRWIPDGYPRRICKYILGKWGLYLHKTCFQ